MSSSFEELLGESLPKEELDVALYIYIGQNIRDQGILKQDSYLRKMASFVEPLIDKEIVEQSRWYNFNVLTISYRFTVPIRELMEARLKNEKEIDALIAGCGKKLSAFIQLLRETGARSGELQ